MHTVAMKQHNRSAMNKPNGLDPKNSYGTVTRPRDQPIRSATKYDIEVPKDLFNTACWFRNQ